MKLNERSEHTTKHNVIFVHFLHIHLYLGYNIFVGILNEMEFNMGLFTFHRKMEFNLRKRGFIRVMNGNDFYEGNYNTRCP